MEALKINCIISRYDETITEPPFKTIRLSTCEVVRPLTDNGGEKFFENIKSACKKQGYNAKFYTSTKEKGFTFEIVVY
jgi:hypothetical protein